jgi:uncharacterized radical SAM superfamily protein
MSWEVHGRKITFYLPGMFTYDGLTGRYPGISITGNGCSLQCDHCKGRILETMISATSPDLLVATCVRLAEKGNHGILISGGCDEAGCLPWGEFIPAIEKIKRETGLYISIHSGLMDDETALSLRRAGVDQALIDVIGDDETYRKICHVPFGISRIETSLKAAEEATLPVIPHVVCGLYYGGIRGERKAVEMISRFRVKQVVVVSLMRIPGTPLWEVEEPTSEDVAGIIAEARFKVPEAKISLGCARQRGNSRLELLAIDAGVNKMALPSEEAVRKARDYGLEVRYQRTCCSVSEDFSREQW